MLLPYLRKKLVWVLLYGRIWIKRHLIRRLALSVWIDYDF